MENEMTKLLIALAIIMPISAYAEPSFHQGGAGWYIQDEHGTVIETGMGVDSPHSMHQYEQMKQNAQDDMRVQQATDQFRDALQDSFRR